MQFWIGVVIGVVIAVLIIAFVLYKIAVSLFSERYVRFVSMCYLTANWLFIILLIVPYFYPAMIGNYEWGYFLVYAPLFAIYLLPALLTVGIAHIACKIKYRDNKHSVEIAEKICWVANIFFPVSLFLSLFFSTLLYFIGILLVIIVSIYRVIYFVKRKFKPRT